VREICICFLFSQVLENMNEITYSSTWSEAQVLLLENSSFKNDVSLLGMDKEDALIGMLLYSVS
jgi:pre-mRNA-processing factor 40